jgi:putative transcriptional regulator
MNSPQQDCLKGHFLMAMPGLMDPNFHRTVTYICEHTRQGAMGIIIDRPLPELTGENLFRELNIPFLRELGGVAVYFGGPVHTGEIFVLHGPPFHWAGCLVVSPSFGLSNTIDVLESIASGKGPEDFIITLGCSGWGEGQLEAEMRENAWLSCAASTDIAFHTPPERRWMAAIQKLGIDPDLLSGEAGHA